MYRTIHLSSCDLYCNTNWVEEDFVLSEFPKMKVQFVNKGIPVIIGEHAYKLTNNLVHSKCPWFRTSAYKKREERKKMQLKQEHIL